MPQLADMDWATASEEARINALKRATTRQVCAMARVIEWEPGSIGVIGWIAAQQGVDLGSAVTMFLNAEPELLAHADKDRLPPHLCAKMRTLDALAQRINAGFYLPDALREMSEPHRLVSYLNFQASVMGPPPRWTLNTLIVTRLLTEIRLSNNRRRQAPIRRREKSIKALFTPLMAPFTG